MVYSNKIMGIKFKLSFYSGRKNPLLNGLVIICLFPVNIFQGF